MPEAPGRLIGGYADEAAVHQTGEEHLSEDVILEIGLPSAYVQRRPVVEDRLSPIGKHEKTAARTLP
jgi:hypothetical protein